MQLPGKVFLFSHIFWYSFFLPKTKRLKLYLYMCNRNSIYKKVCPNSENFKMNTSRPFISGITWINFRIFLIIVFYSIFYSITMFNLCYAGCFLLFNISNSCDFYCHTSLIRVTFHCFTTLIHVTFYWLTSTSLSREIFFTNLQL